MGKTAVIIGGGVGGLAAAIHLARRNIRAILLEKNARVGGKLNLWAVPHPDRPSTDALFKFDTGPSLLTLPLVFQDLFAAAGEDVRDYLPIQRIDPIARFRWSDGTTFQLRADEQDRLREIRNLAPDDVAGFERLYRFGEKVWNISADPFLFHAPQQMLRRNGYSPLAAVKMLAAPFRIGLFDHFAKRIDRHIANPKLRQVMYQYATYSGADPSKAPATLAVIPYVEMSFGAWYIPGGMYKLAEALETVARKMGIEIRTETEITRILVNSDRTHHRATGVITRARETIEADIVVANSDTVYTYRELIDPRFRKRYNDRALDRIDPGTSAFALMLGIDGTYPQLAHHNKFMQDDSNDCIYVCAPTRSDPTVAPDGCENLFLLGSAPALGARIDWQTEAKRCLDRLIDTLQNKWGLTDLRKRIVVERAITPADFKSLYNANAGSIYGIASNSRRSAFLRPPNRDREIAGLYFAGGATHPGGGLPLVALSGKIVGELVDEDFAGS